MKRPLSTLKSWFRRGLKPTESQFSDWLDSFWHKDENIPQSNVSGLSDSLKDIDKKADKALFVAEEAMQKSGDIGYMVQDLSKAVSEIEENIQDNYYTKENLQTAGQAQVHWDNITNKDVEIGDAWRFTTPQKTYVTVAAMQADLTPVANDNTPFEKGWMVIIQTALETDPDNNSIYFYQNTGVGSTNWKFGWKIEGGGTGESLWEADGVSSIKPKNGKRVSVDSLAETVVTETALNTDTALEQTNLKQFLNWDCDSYLTLYKSKDGVFRGLNECLKLPIPLSTINVWISNVLNIGVFQEGTYYINFEFFSTVKVNVGISDTNTTPTVSANRFTIEANTYTTIKKSFVWTTAGMKSLRFEKWWSSDANSVGDLYIGRMYISTNDVTQLDDVYERGIKQSFNLDKRKVLYNMYDFSNGNTINVENIGAARGWKFPEKIYEDNGVRFRRFTPVSGNWGTKKFQPANIKPATSNVVAMLLKVRASKLYDNAGFEIDNSGVFSILYPSSMLYTVTSKEWTWIRLLYEPTFTFNINIAIINMTCDLDIAEWLFYDGDLKECDLSQTEFQQVSVSRLIERAETKEVTNLNLFKKDEIEYMTYKGLYASNTRSLSNAVSNKIYVKDSIAVLNFGGLSNADNFYDMWDAEDTYLGEANFWAGNIAIINKSSFLPNTHYVRIRLKNTINIDKLYVYDGVYPWREVDYLTNKGFTVDDLLPSNITKLTTVGKNLFIDVVKDSNNPNIVGTPPVMTGGYSQGARTVFPIDVSRHNGKSVTLSGIPIHQSGVTTQPTIRFYNSDFTVGLNLASPIILSKIDGADFYGGTLTVPTGAKVMWVQLPKAPAGQEAVDFDYSSVQIEFSAVATSYEKPIFGASEIGRVPVFGYPQNTNSASIGIAFIFGDSITSTNQPTFTDDPLNYQNQIQTWVQPTMAACGIIEYYNFARGNARFTTDTHVSGMQDIYGQVSRALQFVNDNPDKIPNLIINMMGTNDASNVGDPELAWSSVMTDLGGQGSGFIGTLIENLDRATIGGAMKWGFHTIAEKFPNAIVMQFLPPQAAARSQTVGVMQKNLLDLITRFSKMYGFEVVDTDGESGISRMFETIGYSSGQYQPPHRDLSDQVHPNASGVAKLARYFASKINSRFL